jgi:hypothetical protein
MSGTAAASTQAVTTQVPSSAAVAGVDIFAAANPGRKAFHIVNNSTQVLFLNFSATPPTSSNYSVKIAAGGVYEPPVNYQGQIKGLWSAANGAALVTEYT